MVKAGEMGMKKVWESLTNSGTQEEAYPDNPRTDIRGMFAFQPKRILDIGCGLWAVSGALKHDFPETFAWGCELNPITADVAQTRLDKVSRTPMEEWGGDELELLKTVDTVLLLDVLEHMYNPWSTLQVLREHLPEHAQVIVSLPNCANIHIFHELANGFWHYKPAGVLDVTHIRFFTHYEMRKMFYETGFKVAKQAYPYFLPYIQEDKVFPFWFGAESMQLYVKDQSHWESLNAVQIYFNLVTARDDQLTEEELTFKHESHPPTVS